METWDVYNNKRELTGKIVERDNYDFMNNEFHLVAIIWVVNTKGEYLVQRRALDKELYPGVYATHGGSVLSGESSIEGAIRETFEEVGVLLRKDELKHFSTHSSENTIYDHYLSIKDITIDDTLIDPVEVDSCMFMSYEEMISLVEKGSFIKYNELHYKDYFKELNELVKL